MKYKGYTYWTFLKKKTMGRKTIQRYYRTKEMPAFTE